MLLQQNSLSIRRTNSFSITINTPVRMLLDHVERLSLDIPTNEATTRPLLMVVLVRLKRFKIDLKKHLVRFLFSPESRSSHAPDVMTGARHKYSKQLRHSKHCPKTSKHVTLRANNHQTINLAPRNPAATTINKTQMRSSLSITSI